MKSSGPAAAIVAALILVVGATVAVQAATGSTGSTKLCVQKNAVYGSVYAPDGADPTCQRGFRLVRLSSDGAVDALQSQVDALEGQVADAQAQAARTKTVSWHGAAVFGSVPIAVTVGDWSVDGFCRPLGSVANDLLDGITVAHLSGQHMMVISRSDGSGGGEFVAGAVASFAFPRDTQTVQLASTEGPNEGLTVTASRTRSDNNCWMTVTASAG